MSLSVPDDLKDFSLPVSATDTSITDLTPDVDYSVSINSFVGAEESIPIFGQITSKCTPDFLNVFFLLALYLKKATVSIAGLHGMGFAQVFNFVLKLGHEGYFKSRGLWDKEEEQTFRTAVLLLNATFKKSLNFIS